MLLHEASLCHDKLAELCGGKKESPPSRGRVGKGERPWPPEPGVPVRTYRISAVLPSAHAGTVCHL